MKTTLSSAAKAAGRSLASELEARLQRTLDEDRGKTIDEVLLDRIKAKFTDLVAGELKMMAMEYARHASELRYYRDQRAAGLAPDEIPPMPSERDAANADTADPEPTADAPKESKCRRRPR
jgi:hypothetical protein